MIVVDTSALMALLLGEADADRIADVLERSETIIMSAGTLAEALIVAARHGFDPEMRALLDGLGVEVDVVTAARAFSAAGAYATFGKGNHPAALNFGDCFAYAAAQALQAPLLYVGDDFAQTDVEGALGDE